MSDDVPQKHLCKYYKNKVVRLNKTLQNVAGDIFHKGELMVIRQKTKKGPFELNRPLGGINLEDEDEFTVLGDLKDLLKCEADDDK